MVSVSFYQQAQLVSAIASVLQGTASVGTAVEAARILTASLAVVHVRLVMDFVYRAMLSILSYRVLVILT